jgi:hypothetical protein
MSRVTVSLSVCVSAICVSFDNQLVAMVLVTTTQLSKG